MLGEGCLNVGDAKLTLGTGSFLCVNIGSEIVPPNTGFYPVVGWSKSVRTDESLSCEDIPDTKLEDITFLLEGFNSDSGNSLVKLKESGCKYKHRKSHSKSCLKIIFRQQLHMFQLLNQD
ncbi:hypothetical protein ACTXT7_015959 [Hymenolepis weldensis]